MWRYVQPSHVRAECGIALNGTENIIPVTRQTHRVSFAFLAVKLVAVWSRQCASEIDGDALAVTVAKTTTTTTAPIRVKHPNRWKRWADIHAHYHKIKIRMKQMQGKMEVNIWRRQRNVHAFVLNFIATSIGLITLLNGVTRFLPQLWYFVWVCVHLPSASISFNIIHWMSCIRLIRSTAWTQWNYARNNVRIKWKEGCRRRRKKDGLIWSKPLNKMYVEIWDEMCLWCKCVSVPLAFEDVEKTSFFIESVHLFLYYISCRTFPLL